MIFNVVWCSLFHSVFERSKKGIYKLQRKSTARELVLVAVVVAVGQERQWENLWSFIENVGHCV